MTTLHAQTQVSGVVDGEIWSKAGNPYQVVGNVNALQLTIEPGVEIEFAGDYSFKISGYLKAQGTADDSIRFYSAATNSSGWKGLYFDNASSNCILQYVKISEASGKYALKAYQCSLSFSQLTISDNQTTAVYLDNASMELIHCSIVDNQGYGCDVANGASLTLTACTIVGNQDNGLHTDDGSITLQNSVVARNQNEGILLSLTNDLLNAVNSVIAFNGKEGIIGIGGQISLSNSIVYFNNALNQIANVGGTTTVSYSDVDQPNLGSTNLMVDPQFADTKLRFNLLPQSPVIDAGDPDAAMNDQYFPPSLGGPRNDMGAYGGPLARKWYRPLFVAPDSLAFGDVSLGDSVRSGVLLKNYSDAALTVNAVSLSGSDAQQFSLLEPSLPITIPMADSLFLPVIFHPDAARLLPFSARLDVESDVDNRTVGVSGRGVVPDIFVMPTTLNFSTTAVGKEDSLKIKIYNLGTDTLRIDSVRVISAAYTYRLNERKLAPQSDTVITMTVYFKPDSIGDFLGRLDIFSNDPDESPLSVEVDGNGAAPFLNVSPLRADFDSVRVFKDSVVTLFLSNEGNAELIIDSLRLLHNTPQFSVETTPPLSISAGTSQVPLLIRFHADTTGFYTDTLRLVCNDPFRPVRLIPFKALAIAPYVSVSARRIDFGQIIVPHDSVLWLKLKNAGNVPLRVDHFGLSGADAASFSWWVAKGDLTVNPQDDSLVVHIRCAPQRSGLLQAKFDIVANDPRYDSLRIDLIAQAKAPEMAINPDTLQFPPTIILTKVERQVKIVNRGDYDLRIDSLKISRMNGTDFQFSALQFPQNLRPQIDTLTFSVSFAPITSGLQKVGVQFFSNDPFVNPRTLLIKGQGVTPILNASLDSIDFGAVSLYRHPLQKIVFYNTGSAVVRIDSISVVNDPDHAFIVPQWNQIIQIAPGDSLGLSVIFAPPKIGTFNARLQVQWNNPYAQDLVVPLKARADSAVLLVPAQLDFGKQAVHSITTRKLPLKNKSHVWIKIDSIRIIGVDSAQFLTDLSGINLTFQPSDTLIELPVEYVPHAVGLHKARLQIFSADLKQKLFSINLQGIALAAVSAPLLISDWKDSVDFGSVFVDENRQKTCMLMNFGNAPLLIDSITIKGQASGEFVALNSPLAVQLGVDDTLKDFAIRFTPQAPGRREALLQVFSNDAQSPMSLILYGQGEVDASPATITPTFNVKQAVAGKPFTISVQAFDDNTSIRKTEVYIKQGGQSAFQMLDMQKSGQKTWQVTVDSSMMTMRGLLLYFKAYHGGRVTLYPTQGAQQAMAVQVHVPHVRFPFFMPPEKYRMIALPLYTAPQTLSDLFTDDLGKYDPYRYRFFDWDVTQQAFVELNKMDKSLSVGRAFYLITADTVDLDVDNALSVASDKAFELTLTQGWNLIGDPFAFPVAWKNIEGAAHLTLFYYNGAAWEIADSLLPFRGYAVKAPQNMTLQIPPSSTNANLAKVKSSVETGWRFRLKLRSGAYYDNINFAGVREGAKEKIDSFDIPEPPVIGTFVSLYFTEKNPKRAKLTADFKPSQQDGYRFDFTVCGNTGKPLQLDIEADSLPKDFEWCVVSPQNGVRYGQLPIRLYGSKQNLRLLVGKKDFVKAELAAFRDLPLRFRLHQNYPNPFNSRTTIQVDLPSADRLSIVIYDITGRRVKTLSKRRLLDAGYHTFVWDGSDRFGIPVASGIYFIHLQGRKFRADRKIILQK